MSYGKLGMGGIVVVVLGLLAKQYFGVDLGLGGGSPSTTRREPAQPIDPAKDPDRVSVEFVHFMVNDLEASWTKRFAAMGKTYQPPDLVLFTDATESGCGVGRSSVGPFYCPADRKVYIDLGFFQLLADRFGAPGEFARAYVLAHEIGHHVQNLLGYDDEMRAEQQRDPERANELSVRFELQADCLAGVYGKSPAKADLLEPGDVEAGLAAAAAIGDDTLQKQGGGRVSPESWTHGSSDQRATWLRRGLDQGSVEACDTRKARL